MSQNEISTWLVQPYDPNTPIPLKSFRFVGKLPTKLRFRASFIYNLEADARLKCPNDNPNLTLANFDIKSIPHVDMTWMQERGYAPAILTKAQAGWLAHQHRGRVEVYASLEAKAFFFVNDYCYRLDRVEGVLPDHWVPCSFYLPMEVVPRPGLEDGIIKDLDQWIFIFENDSKLIESEIELKGIL